MDKQIIEYCATVKMNDLKLYRAIQINLDNLILHKKGQVATILYNMNDSVNKISKLCITKNKLEFYPDTVKKRLKASKDIY